MTATTDTLPDDPGTLKAMLLAERARAERLEAALFGLLKQPEVPRIAKLPAHPEKLRLGWVVYEEVGMAVVNDYAISRITVS